jgi:hypothetical protein
MKLHHLMLPALLIALASACGPQVPLGKSRQAEIILGEGFPAPSSVEDAIAGVNAQLPDGYALAQVLGRDYALWVQYDDFQYVQDALAAVQGMQEWQGYDWIDEREITQGQFEAQMGTTMLQVMPSVDAWLGQPGEPRQFGYLKTQYMGAPGSWTWETLFVVVYYESMNIAIIDRIIYET